MSLKEKIINHTIVNFEGIKYTNIPGDYGGPTKFGITQKTLEAYLGKKVTPDDVKNMSMELAIRIYDKNYWQFFNIDWYPTEVQHIVYDMYVNSSPTSVGKIIQRALNSLGEKLVVDGVVGHKTVSSLVCHSPDSVLQAIIKQRKVFYNGLVKKNATQEKFLAGWLNRVSWFEKNKLTA